MYTSNIFIVTFVAAADSILENGNGTIGPETTECALRLPPRLVLLGDMGLMNSRPASLRHDWFKQRETAVTIDVKFLPIFGDQGLSLGEFGSVHLGNTLEDEVLKDSFR